MTSGDSNPDGMSRTQWAGMAAGGFIGSFVWTAFIGQNIEAVWLRATLGGIWTALFGYLGFLLAPSLISSFGKR
jgi:hypothetical protein